VVYQVGGTILRW